MPDMALSSDNNLPGIGLVPAPVHSSVASPSWTMRLPERSSGSASPRVFPATGGPVRRAIPTLPPSHLRSSARSSQRRE